MAAAAAIVVIAGTTIVWRRIARQPDGSLGSSAAVASSQRTGPGERRVIALPDGSQATLGAASELRLGDGFAAGRGGGVRDVFLRGEAIFAVRHDPRRSFRVHAGGAVAEDIGTSFGVRAYPGERGVRVAVSEGSVSLRREGSDSAAAAVLRARDVGRLSDTGDAIVAHGQSVERLLAWASGELAFDDAPLAEVLPELERWYDVEIRLGDPGLGARHLTATFHGEGIDEVLRVVSMSLELRVERQGRVVTLHPAGSPAMQEMRPAAPRRVEAGV
jgi:transmembrane sensor